MPSSSSSKSKFFAHRRALLATVGAMAVFLGVGSFATYSFAATKGISGRGIVRSGSGADSIPLDFSLTVPADEKLNGETGELRIASTTKVYQSIGQTKVGGKLQPVKTKRIRAQNVNAGTEVTFKGTYAVGDKNSVRPIVVYVNDRSFTVCGKLQGITRRTAAGANQNTFTIEVTKATVQEKRYDRFFPAKKDVLFTFADGTQFHNADGTWVTPKNRVSIQAADVVASQQTTAVRGNITGNSALEVNTVDLGAKCS